MTRIKDKRFSESQSEGCDVEQTAQHTPIAVAPVVTAREREKLRFAVIKEFRSAGRYDWSDREVDAEVDRRSRKLAAKRRATPQLELGLQPAEQVSRRTKSAACGATRRQRITLRDRVELELRAAGLCGLTRRELAERLSVEPGSISQPANDLLREGIATQPKTKRCQRTGQMVAVMVHCEHSGRPTGGG